jgi:hypothetical protein
MGENMRWAHQEAAELLAKLLPRGAPTGPVRQARQKFVITIIQSGSDCLALLGDHPFMDR